MSRALGAAFLSHQVEQLERSVGSRASTTDNWRTRPSPSHSRRGRPESHVKRPSREDRKPREDHLPQGSTRTSAEKEFPIRKDKDSKADIVVTDASVLIHAPSYLREWCRDGSNETVIVPLEVLNTLDALKKGSSSIARLARSASRILEQQVGVNERIKVQRDEAFLGWDELLQSLGGKKEEASTNTGEQLSEQDDPPLDKDDQVQPAQSSPPSPEWLRRTLCCAAYEVSSHKSHDITQDADTKTAPKKVVLAISSPPPSTGTNPVHTNPKQDRAAGSLLSTWASMLSIPTLVVPHDPVQAPSTPNRDREKEKQIIVEKPPGTLAMQGAKVNVDGVGREGQKVMRLLTRGEKLDP